MLRGFNIYWEDNWKSAKLEFNADRQEEGQIIDKHASFR